MKSEIALPDLLKAAEKITLPDAARASHNRKATFAFSVVNNKSGKRIVFNRELSNALALTDSVDIMPISSEGCVIAASSLPIKNALHYSLRDKAGIKTVYSSNAVYTLTACFELDYSEHTSLSFYDVTIDKLEDGTPVAVIMMRDISDPSVEVDKNE